MKKLLFSLLFVSLAAQAADPLPNFNLWVGKSHYITVKGTDDGRLSVLLWQLGRPESLPGQIRTMLKLTGDEADMVEFIVPAAACKFAKKYILTCDDWKLSDADKRSREVVLRVASAGAKEVARFTGAQLGNDGMRIKFSHDLVTRESIAVESKPGETQKSLSTTFSASVWLYLGENQNGWAGLHGLSFSLRD